MTTGQTVTLTQGNASSGASGNAGEFSLSGGDASATGFSVSGGDASAAGFSVSGGDASAETVLTGQTTQISGNTQILNEADFELTG